MRSRLHNTVALFALFQSFVTVLRGAEQKLWGLEPDYSDNVSDHAIEVKTDVAGLIVFPSPDRRYAISWPDLKSAQEQNFETSNHLVDLKTGKSTGKIMDRDGDFENRNHGGMRVKWRPDGRAFIFRAEGKWSPRLVAVCQIGEDGSIKETNLINPVAEAFAALLSKEAPNFWNNPDPPAEYLDCNIGCAFNKKGDGLIIQAKFEMNPRQMPGATYAAGNLKGTFDFKTGKLSVSSRKLTDARRIKKE